MLAATGRYKRRGGGRGGGGEEGRGEDWEEKRTHYLHKANIHTKGLKNYAQDCAVTLFLKPFRVPVF